MQQAARMAPDVFTERMEPLYRMIKQHEQLEDNNDNSSK
jgi:hypothetical protein